MNVNQRVGGRGRPSSAIGPGGQQSYHALAAAGRGVPGASNHPRLPSQPPAGGPYPPVPRPNPNLGGGNFNRAQLDPSVGYQNRGGSSQTQLQPMDYAHVNYAGSVPATGYDTTYGDWTNIQAAGQSSVFGQTDDVVYPYSSHDQGGSQFGFGSGMAVGAAGGAAVGVSLADASNYGGGNYNGSDFGTYDLNGYNINTDAGFDVSVDLGGTYGGNCYDANICDPGPGYDGINDSSDGYGGGDINGGDYSNYDDAGDDFSNSNPAYPAPY